MHAILRGLPGSALGLVLACGGEAPRAKTGGEEVGTAETGAGATDGSEAGATTEAGDSTSSGGGMAGGSDDSSTSADGDTGSACAGPQYPIGVPFAINTGPSDGPFTLPVGDASYAVLMLHEGEIGPVTEVTAELTLGPPQGPADVFPGELGDTRQWATPAAAGVDTFGPFDDPQLPAMEGAVVADFPLPSGTNMQENMRLPVEVVRVTPTWLVAAEMGARPGDGDIDAVLAALDDLAPRLETALGPLPDVDGNGRVNLVFSPVIEGMDSDGYAHAPDTLTVPFALGSISLSNGGECLYVRPPADIGQPGAVGAALSALAQLHYQVLKWHRNGVGYTRFNAQSRFLEAAFGDVVADLEGYGNEARASVSPLFGQPKFVSFQHAVRGRQDDPNENVLADDREAHRAAAYLFTRYVLEQAEAAGADGLATLAGIAADAGFEEEPFGTAAGVPSMELWRDLLLTLVSSGEAEDPRFAFASTSAHPDTAQQVGFDPVGTIIRDGSETPVPTLTRSGFGDRQKMIQGSFAVYTVEDPSICEAEVTLNPISGDPFGLGDLRVYGVRLR